MSFAVGVQENLGATVPNDEAWRAKEAARMEAAHDRSITAFSNMALSGSLAAMELAGQTNEVLGRMNQARAIPGAPAEVQQRIRAQLQPMCEALTAFLLQVRKELDEPLIGVKPCPPVR